MFCPKCGASIGIDFGKTRPNDPLYGISVRISDLESEPKSTDWWLAGSTVQQHWSRLASIWEVWRYAEVGKRRWFIWYRNRPKDRRATCFYLIASILCLKQEGVCTVLVLEGQGLKEHTNEWSRWQLKAYLFPSHLRKLSEGGDGRSYHGCFSGTDSSLLAWLV